uniref:Ubiquinone biosynthesis O-methyltransferase, mitochondrial n=1 Tax=Chromera velia CCMP2878 TaxID=1169474 RepID=A0A0G4FCZ4_9ALVE|eukprot:Cvel_16281.t1-p1 / transcript=Cvel_16281.t1 / gene=Cvel_16281 / organism=Chromera_velia_CCMP2878 / gene_product=Hexaprenyldihydroxybenzoate methyltransferase,, putative / transcript_product=Hexaprenyldihydroxybenzoate methyltransferase,, putative / location=Cvel_scaffold1246:49113-51075(-) / protein_length=278 / sequence_SO=supercontig / SO=protein_coding / is_pseudo=false
MSALLRRLSRGGSSKPSWPAVGVSRSFSSSTSAETEKEIAHFNKLAKEWWDPNGPFAGLHDYNKVRVPFVEKNLVPYARQDGSVAFQSLSGFRILDVGCGGGLLTDSLARKGASVLGIDLSEESLKVAMQHRDQQPKALCDLMTFRKATVKEMAESEPEAFDCVVASEVIEHVDCVDSFFHDCVKCVKSGGGALVITTLNRTAESYLLGIVVAEYVMGLVPKGTHSWEKFVEPKQLLDLGKLNGLTHKGTEGLLYIPPLRQFISEPMSRINYMIAFKK